METELLQKAESNSKEGFWMCYHRLRNEGYPWNHKRVYRIYCLLGLNLRRKTKKRLPQRVKEPIVIPNELNHTWSMDFMMDATETGGKMRTFNILDDFNREALHVEINRSIKATNVIYVLNRLVNQRGAPKKIRMDNGPEFISEILATWVSVHDIELKHIEPGKPTQNSLIERFNRTFRENILNAYIFKDLNEAREITEKWLYDYNYTRPHSALGWKSPKQYVGVDLLKTPKKSFQQVNTMMMNMND